MSVSAMCFFLAGCTSQVLDAELVGCADYDRAGLCTADPGAPLYLRVRPKADAPWLRADAETQVWLGGTEVGGRFEAPVAAAEVEVRRGRAQVVLQVAPPPVSALPASAEPRQELEALSAGVPEGLDGVRAHWRRGHAHRRLGQAEAAYVAFLTAGGAAEAQGYLSHAIRAYSMAALTALDQHELAQAQAAIDAIPRVPGWPEGQVIRDHHAAVVSRSLGDFRRASREFEAARQGSAALGTSFQRFSAHELAMMWLEMGRLDEAYAQLSNIEVPEAEACERAALASNRAWAQILKNERGDPRDVDPDPLLAEAQALYAGPCAYPQGLAHARLNRSLAALQRGDLEQAQVYLTATSTTEPDLVLWRSEVEARVALGRKDYNGAQRTFVALAERGRSRASIGAQWRAAVGLGQVFEAQGQVEAAVEAYREAEALLLRDSLRIPLGEGRLGFFVDRQRSARALVSLLARAGRPSQALDAARRAGRRARLAVASHERAADLPPEARQAWALAFGRYQRAQAAWTERQSQAWRRTQAEAEAERTEDLRAEQRVRRTLDAALSALGDHARPETQALPALPKDALTLAWFAISEGGLIFVAEAGQVDLRRYPPGGLAAALSPLRDRLLAAPWVRLLAYEDAPLPAWLSRRATFALDLSPPPPRAGGQAWVLADPSQNLPHTRLEGQRAAQALGESMVVRHRTGRAVTQEAMREALANADFLHYAGHAVSDGLEGFESRLSLGDDSTLSLGAVLASPRVPAEVVLSGCETASYVLRPQRGLDLAQAFVAAGARAVVAAPRPIEDARADVFMKYLYEAWAHTHDLEAAFYAARRRAPQAGFVLVVP